ncbi:hypothetical protein [Microbulbifer spongiae]|uniref:Uncharacterized protein n=1 Tax=Microbulbifer spongiae TaxID=2944933 RepID=A0ABY9EDM2_9GAMM|nr:hypothetical protein [Microbulbifer sp. MI-G]WKD50456.1 hypothetical protein M8T91_03190 [Microbulbifer sp. MI-G]
MLSKWLSRSFGIGAIFASLSASALPTNGWEYFTAVHESGSYNNYEFYRKDHPAFGSSDPSPGTPASRNLSKVTLMRFEAIDYPMRDAINQALVKFSDDENLKITSKSIHTDGILTVSFIPASGVSNVLNFSISGVNVDAFARLKKSWYAEAIINLDVTNITINGTYDYFNGVVNITNVNAPLSADIDVDLDIPLLGLILDPLIDDYVDDEIDTRIPTNLSELFSGENSSTFSVFGIKEFIPLNKLYYNGVDYGPIITDKLETTSLINDNFSVSIGTLLYDRQHFSITVGNVTYRLWSTGYRIPCSRNQLC